MYLYFAGCMATYRMPTIAKATIALLRKANIQFEHLGAEEWCCGSVLFRTGYKKELKDIAEHNAEAFKKCDSGIITSCAGCYRTLKKDYKPYIEGKGIFHIVELLDSLVKEGKLRFPQIDVKVTYHDPCHLGRHLTVYDAPRNLLRAVPGLILVEMERNRENARCCGSGGGLRSAYKELSDSMALERLQEAERTGAEILTTACPFCAYSLREAAKASNSRMRVMDVSEFLAGILT